MKDIPVAVRRNANRNIYPDTVELAGPFPSTAQHPGQKKILICALSAGRPCADRIMANLAHHAYRRPVSKPEVAELMSVYDKAKSGGYTPEQSLQFAITAMLVSPKFLYRIESDPRSEPRARAGGPPEPHKVSDLELASRLSYFLWSSMPDDELLRLAETNKLHQPEIFDAQVKRLIADQKSAAFAENFPGQWLENSQPRRHSSRRQEVPRMDA